MRRVQVGRRDIQLAVASMLRACLSSSGLPYRTFSVTPSLGTLRAMPVRHGKSVRVPALGEIQADKKLLFEADCRLRIVGRGVRGQNLILSVSDGRRWNFQVKQWWENGRCQTKAIPRAH